MSKGLDLPTVEGTTLSMQPSADVQVAATRGIDVVARRVGASDTDVATVLDVLGLVGV